MHDFSSALVINFGKAHITITKHFIGDEEVFRVSFSDKRPPLLMSMKLTLDKNDYWTSLQTGREKEAQAVGLFLNEYLK